MFSKIVYYSLMFLIIVFFVEGSSYIIVERYLVKKGIIYKPPLNDNYKNYYLNRDPLLGWPYLDSIVKQERDSSGSRIIPSYPDPSDQACVSLYGDSFTWGHQVVNEFAWSNILSKLLNCRVSNFGVNGYGTDQAYLRFKHNDVDKAKIVILGYLSENIVRNVTQFFFSIWWQRT